MHQGRCRVLGGGGAQGLRAARDPAANLQFSQTKFYKSCPGKRRDFFALVFEGHAPHPSPMTFLPAFAEREGS